MEKGEFLDSDNCESKSKSKNWHYWLVYYLQRRSEYYSKEEGIEEFKKQIGKVKKSGWSGKCVERHIRPNEENLILSDLELKDDEKDIEFREKIESAQSALEQYFGKDIAPKRFDLKKASEEKARIIGEMERKLFDMHREYLQIFGNIDFEHTVVGEKEVEDTKANFLHEDFLNPILDKITGDDYSIPESFGMFLWDLFVVQSCYACLSKEKVIPLKVIIYPELLYRLDFASFMLLAEGGKILGELPSTIKREKQINCVKKGKEKQKAKTEKPIKEKYDNLGAIWCEDEPIDFPILLKDADGKNHKRISVHQMAGRIFIEMKGAVTQRTINDHLIALRQKGEI